MNIPTPNTSYISPSALSFHQEGNQQSSYVVGGQDVRVNQEDLLVDDGPANQEDNQPSYVVDDEPVALSSYSKPSILNIQADVFNPSDVTRVGTS